MKGKVLIIIIILILILIGSLTIYKFSNKDSDLNITLKIDEEKKETSDINDKEKYQSSIINNRTTSFDIDLVINEDSILGKLYIDKDGYISIYNSKNDKVEKISGYKFIDLKMNNTPSNELNFYAISSDKEIYNFYLNDLDPSKIKGGKITTEFLVESFTNLKFNTIENISSLNLFVLASDNNIYDVITGMRYIENAISFRDTYIVYDDLTIANSLGNMLKDENEELFKIRYYIECWEENGPFLPYKYFIVTENNKIIYTTSDSPDIYLYKYKVKDISYNKSENVYNGTKIKITFEDNSTKEFTGMFYDEYFGLK